DLISDDFQSPEDLNELFASIRTKGIDVLDRQPVLPSTASEREFGQQDVQATEEVEPELVSGALDKTDDPLRIYLRQMGLVDLLTRQGEVDLAKRIERGESCAIKATSPWRVRDRKSTRLNS